MKVKNKNKLTSTLAIGISLFSSVLSMAAAAPYRVGLILEASKSDHSFNQAAYEGAIRAQKALGIQLDVVEGKDPITYAKTVQRFAEEGKDLILAMGTSGTKAITATAKNYLNQKFVVIDDLPSGPNTSGMRFRNEEGGFLVGYLAARSSSTGVIGFIGGMNIPVINEFEAGFREGIKLICPECTFLPQYVGTTVDAWNNPTAGAKIASDMKNKGADIIFAVAGASGMGAIKYINGTECLKASELPKGVIFKNDSFAKVKKSQIYLDKCVGNTRPFFFIGSNYNQNDLGDNDNNPATLNHGLTTMVDNIDETVYGLINDGLRAQNWRSGERGLGLENDGIYYAFDQYNKALIPNDLKDQLEKVRKLIIRRAFPIPKK